MSLWKYRFRSLVPRRNDRSFLPTALAGVLALTIAVQLALSGPVPLPTEAAVRERGTHYATPIVSQSAVDEAILAHPLFAPRQQLSVNADRAGPRLLDGAQVAGMVAIRGRKLVVVRRADGKILNLASGQAIGGWRLVGIDVSSAIFVHDGKRVVVAYSAAQAAAPEADESAAQ